MLCMYHKQKPMGKCINKRAKMQHLKPTIQQTNEALLQDSKVIANVYPKKNSTRFNSQAHHLDESCEGHRIKPTT